MEANEKLRKLGMPADDDEAEVFIGDIRKAEDLRFSTAFHDHPSAKIRTVHNLRLCLTASSSHPQRTSGL